MGGRSRLMSVIRRQDYYRPMLLALAECGIAEYAILPPTGRGHPILKFRVGAAEHRIPIPGSPSGGSEAGYYIPAEIRRKVRGNKGR